MAITTYSELKTAVENWLDRTDLTSRVPEFIALAEARFNRRLRVSAMETTGSDTMSSNAISLPTDWLSFTSVYLDDSPDYVLDQISQNQAVRRDDSSTSIPNAYYIAGGSVVFSPISDSARDVGYTYHKKIPALSDSNTSNWLLTSHPDAYLYGALAEAEPYMKNDNRAAMWKAIVAEIVDDIEDSDGKWSGAPLVMRSA